MSLIHVPNTQARETLVKWADAFGCVIEIRAEAAHDTALHKTLNDAAREIRVSHGVKLSENQQAVNHAVKKLKMDDYREISKRWKDLRKEVTSMGWELTEEIHFEQTGNGIVVWQGAGSGPRAITDQILRGRTWGGADAMLVCQFLEFVAASSQVVDDPRLIAQEYLERQGITKDNFHEHADKIAFDNPWN